MKKILTLLGLIVFLSFFMFAQKQNPEEQIKSKWPENIKIELEKLIKSEEENNTYNFSLIKTFLLPAMGNKIYSVVFFKAHLDEDVSEIKDLIMQRYKNMMDAYEKEKKKRPEKEIEKPPPLTFPREYHHFYMHIYKNKGDKKEFYLKYNAPIPYSEGEKAIFYTFGVPLDPGDYTLAIEITRTDYSKMGTSLIPLKIPPLNRIRKISFSEPIFIKNFKQMNEAETVFTIHRNNFQIGRILFFPYLNYKFQSNESPALLLQIFGTSLDMVNRTYNIDCRLSIKKGKKVVVKFKRLSLIRPSLYQPIVFRKTESELLEPGDYILLLEIWDRISNRRGKIEIPFSII